MSGNITMPAADFQTHSRDLATPKNQVPAGCKGLLLHMDMLPKTCKSQMNRFPREAKNETDQGGKIQ